MTSENDADRYETTTFRPLGWAGAILFTLAPPIFLYQYWLVFFTTAVEENPSIGPVMAIACVATFASIPMMIAGRRRRISGSPLAESMPARLSSFRRRRSDPDLSLQPGQAPV